MKGELLAMPVARGRPQRTFLTLSHGSKLYGPVSVRGEYADFIWDGQKYKCHVDEFVSGTTEHAEEVIHSPERPVTEKARSRSGTGIAFHAGGGSSRPRMEIEHSAKKAQSKMAGCSEQRHLLDAFGEAVHAVLLLHEQQFLAVVDGDVESHRFDLLIHMANERKQQAKYAYLHHVETHGCSKHDDTDRR